jgi:hypothetical protein
MNCTRCKRLIDINSDSTIATRDDPPKVFCGPGCLGGRGLVAVEQDGQMVMMPSCIAKPQPHFE